MILESINIDQIIEILRKFKPYLGSLRSGLVEIDEIASKFYKYAKLGVVYNNKEIIGFTSFYCNDRNNKIAFISMIAILPEYTRKGYGRKLIEEVFEYSKKEEMKKICLEVEKTNEEALNFYRKLGFKIENNTSDLSLYLCKIL